MIRINLAEPYKSMTEWVWGIFTRHFDLKPDFNPSITIGTTPNDTIKLSEAFIEMIRTGNFGHEKYFKSEPLLRGADGAPDYLGTAFYLLNSLQEIGIENTTYDKHGRYKYKASLQYKFDIVEQNLVAEYFTELMKLIDPDIVIKYNPQPSRIFVSHDIDNIDGFLQEGKAAILKGRIDCLFLLIVNRILGHLPWQNFDKIMAINDEYDIKSTFFWLVEKGKAESQYSKHEMRNGDYNFDSEKLNNSRKRIKKRGYTNGLHKAIGKKSIKQQLSDSGFMVNSNRNHYLHFRLPDHYQELEESGLKIDASLGFAEHPGFRNSYGFPISPFNLTENKPFQFLEVPLQLMDTTYRFYLGLDASQAEKRILEFVERNKTNTVISLLWHNNSFSDIKFASWLKTYKNIISYISENQIMPVSPDELFSNYFYVKTNG